MNRRFFDEFFKLEREMDRMFNNFIGQPSRKDLKLLGNSLNSKNLMKVDDFREPLVDLWDDKDKVIANIELPGIHKNDIELNVNDESIEIKVEQNSENKNENKDKGYYRYESSSRSFYRCIPIPKNLDKDKVKAKYNNGILEVEILKKKNTDSEIKKINIE